MHTVQNQTTAGNDIVGARGGKERRRERESREVRRGGKEEGERREGARGGKERRREREGREVWRGGKEEPQISFVTKRG